MYTIFKSVAFCLCLFFFISPEVFSQIKSKSTISGQITDAKTGEPLPNVNLFLAYTTIGTITNNEGKYSIKNIPPGQFDLIVSHIGYELTTFQVKLLKPEKLTHNIKLVPKVLKGEKVLVETTTPEEWKQNLKTFIDLFVGKTANSKDCKILNPEIINFKIEPETEVFTASTDSLIYFSNKALGYKMNMILDFFTYDPRTQILKYQVYPRFEFMQHKKEKELKKWKKNRKNTYEGSFRHFISALALGKLKEEKLQIYQYGYIDTTQKIWITRRRKEIKNYKEVFLTPETLGLQNFHFDNFLYCEYKGSKSSWSEFGYTKTQSSWLELTTDFVQIDTLGNCYDELNIIKRGFWGKARMADVLPFDYEADGI